MLIVRADIVRGFKAILPFWIAAAPIAFAYVFAAHDAGLSNAEIALMSLTVYSAPTQLALVQFVTDGASIGTMLITILVLNVPLILYGVSLTKHIPLNRIQKALAAYAFTDGVYSVTIASERNHTLSYLFGAELSMFAAWNGWTIVALLAGEIVTPLRSLPLNVLVPITFFFLLTKMIKRRTDLMVVIGSVVCAVVLTMIGLGDIAVIAVGLGCPLIAVAFSGASK